MKDFLSRYHPRYVRSLTYMMQTSEYRVYDFLRWFRRTEDFLHVEQRKSLVVTAKSKLLLAIGYIFLVALYIVAALMLFLGAFWWKYSLFLLVFAASPFILVYCMTGMLFILQLVQRPVEYVIVRQARKKLAGHPGVKIAIAGSFGKTSMREVLKTVLSVGKKVAAPPGSYNTPLGISSFVKTLMGDEGVLIFELGEYYPGDIRRLCDLVQPDIGIITGVNEAHLEKFKDLEQTRRTIFELSDYLKEKPLYINGENALVRKYVQANHLLYSRAGVGGWEVLQAQTGLNGTSFILKNDTQKIIAVQSHLLGLHQVGPLAVAADITLKLGFIAKHIEQGIANTRPFEHRLEPKTDAQGVTILDDSYNGNPDGVRAVIEFLSTLRGVRRWYMTPGLVEMGARKERVHKEIGRELARAGIEKVVLVRNSVTPFIAKGLQEGQFKGELMWFDKAVDAFAALPSFTVNGDVVLLQNDWPDQYV